MKSRIGESATNVLITDFFSRMTNDLTNHKIIIQVNHVFDPSEFRRRQIALPTTAHHNGLSVGPMISPAGPSFMQEPYSGSGAFLQGKRHHHSHYFSNLDLFTSTNAYNYLRYVKSDELQPNVAKQPNLQARNIGFEKDMRSSFDIAMLRSPVYRRILDNLSFEVFGGETMAVMYTSGTVGAGLH